MSWIFRDPERDPELGKGLRRVEASWELSDAESLRHRIVAAARPTLGRLGSGAPKWWEWLSGWTRIAVPVGLAASLGAGVLLHGRGTTTGLSGSATDMGSDSTLVLAAFSDASAGSQWTAHLIAPEGNDWLLEQAVGQ